MDSLYAALEESYSDRCDSRALALKAWRSFSEAYPPVISPPHGSFPLPSQSLALEAGDTGLAIMWIVQATIVRAFVTDVLRDTESPCPALTALPGASIGSLAHSEDREYPVIIRSSGKSIIVSGKKKYITGGLDSDFILLTARREGDDSITSLIHLPVEMLPADALTNLELGMLKTVSHASLDLREVSVPVECLLDLPPGSLRKHLKRWGIVERVLIMEAFVAAVLHIAHRMLHLSFVNEGVVNILKSQLDIFQTASRSALMAAHAGEHIDTGGADISAVLAEYTALGEIIRSHQMDGTIPETISQRYKDLGLVSGMSR